MLQLSPDRFWDFSKKLFDEQANFFDVNVVNETRNATYRRLAKIAASVNLDEKKVYELLEISDKPGKDGSLNTGNSVTNDLKVLVKMNRLTGVHVTPTVLFNVSCPLYLAQGQEANGFAGCGREQYFQLLQQRAMGRVVGEECCVGSKLVLWERVMNL